MPSHRPSTFDGGTFTPGDVTAGIRPEDVAMLSGPDSGTFPVTVQRVIPHGSFLEVVLDADGEQLRAFRSGAAPGIGSTVHARVERQMTFADGRRTS